MLLSGPSIEAPEQSTSGTPLTGTLRRRWALILCTWMVVAGGASAFIWKHFGTEYKAVGFIKVAPFIRPVLNPDEQSGLLPFYNAFVMGQMQSITHPGVLKRAVESPEVQKLPWTSRVSDPVDYLARKLKIENEQNSELISVSLLGAEPKELAPIVNAVLRAYHEKVVADSQVEDSAQLKLLYQEQAKREEELKNQHDEIYNLANEVGAMPLGDQKDAAFSGIQQVQIELKKAQTERVAAEAHLNALKQRGPTPLSPLELEQLKAEVAAGDLELASLNLTRQMDEQRLFQAQQLGPDHRDVRFTRERLELIKRKMAERASELERSVAGIAEARAAALHLAELKQAEQRFTEASQKEKALQDVSREDFAMLGTMGKNAVQLQALRGKADLTTQLHNQVLQRIQHLEVEKQRPARVTIDTWAAEPTSPAKDQRPKLTILAIIGGFFMALSLAVIVDSRDTFVRCEDDVRRNVGLTVLGTRTIPKRRHVSNKEILACIAEEIRGIRGCVLFAGGRHEFKTLLITSPNPREGKTHTAGDLAVALAESGRRVLLIDADNRKRDLTRRLGADDRPGLADLLANGHLPQEFILATSTTNLSFLPAGPACETFSELLVRPGQLERIRDAFGIYDLVIVDSPPVLLSNDACIWARYMDTVLMVLRARHSAREDALAAKDKLSQMGGRIMGAVLNGVSSRPRYYSRYAYVES
jgi:tyrosine-protein kinase Etk/Wzc